MYPTDKDLIELFKNNPVEFMRICSDISDTTGDLPSFCKYVYIKQSLAMNRPLPEGATALLSELEKSYGEVETTILRPHDGPMDIVYFETLLKTLFSELEKRLEQKYSEGYEGMIEFVVELGKNVSFSKGKRDRNGYKYEIDKVKELFYWLENFKTKVYKLNNQVSIELTPSGFFHILFGHVEGYLVPRKGGAVRFKSIHSCTKLLEFIDQFIEFLKPELIAHYEVENSHFERRSILFMGSQFGIHIKQKKIATLYPVSEYLLKKYSNKD